MQEEMHEQMSGYKRMRREHQSALLKVIMPKNNQEIFVKLTSLHLLQLEDRCKLEMESHKQLLDKEYETLLQQFSKELEKLQIKHQQELEKKVYISYL